MRKVSRKAIGLGIAISMATIISSGIWVSSAMAQTTDFSRCDRRNPDRETTTQRGPGRSGSPYRAALSKVRVLQFPTSGECMDQAQLLDARIVDNIFYMNSSNELIFQFFNGTGRNRLELRGNNFAISSSNKQMIFEYTIPGSSATRAAGFTIGQILSDTPENQPSISGVPILRIEAVKSRRVTDTNGTTRMVTDRLVAATKTSETANTIFRDLGPLQTGGSFGKVTVTYGKSGLIEAKQTVGSTNYIATLKISDLNLEVSNVYFKTGCYIQDPGDCRSTLRRLEYVNVN
jgi:hypothetical protein